jgi:hypothetical protein
MRDNCAGLFLSASLTTEEGNKEMEEIFHSDPILHSSPLRVPFSVRPGEESVADSSPLSSPPRRVDRVAEYRFLLETGDRELIKWQPEETRLELALEYVRSGMTKEGESWRDVADDYGVPRETFRRQLKGGKTRKEAGKCREKLLPSETLAVIDYIYYLNDLGIPATTTTVLEMFQEKLQQRYANEMGVSVRSLDGQALPIEYTAKPHTVRRWVERYPEIKTMLARTLESKRARQTRRDIAVDFLAKLKKMIRKHNIHDQDIWNMDETGYSQGSSMGPATKVIVPASAKHSSRTSSDSREWVSVMESINASGVASAPYFIFKGKVLLARHSNQLERAFGEAGWVHGVSPNGWTDNYHAVQWLTWWEKQTRPSEWDSELLMDRTQEDGSVKRVKNKDLQWEDGIKPAHYRLLILDGHGSHLTGQFISFAIDHNIVFLCLPPHTSHFLQPLDVGVFTNMKRKYRKAVQCRADTGRTKVTRDIFIQLYAQLRPEHLDNKSICRGFEQSGIIPTSIRPLEKHFRNAPIETLGQTLQTLQAPSTPAPAREDRGLVLEWTGVGTNTPADKSLSGEGVYIVHEHNNRVSVNPKAPYHAICEQLRVEDIPDRRDVLIDALQNWCERQEVKVKTYKYAGNIFYTSTVEGKKAAAEAKDRSHLGLGRSLDREAWLAEKARLDEEEEKLRKKKEEQQAKKDAAAAKKVAAAAKKAAKRAAVAPATGVPLPKRRCESQPSRLTDIELLQNTEEVGEVRTGLPPASPMRSLATLASRALLVYREEGELSDAEAISSDTGFAAQGSGCSFNS